MRPTRSAVSKRSTIRLRRAGDSVTRCGHLLEISWATCLLISVDDWLRHGPLSTIINGGAQMRSKISRMSICLALLLLATAPTTFAQRWTSPTIPPEARDRWCRDVGAPIGSPPAPPGPYKVGSNELPFCYLPSDVTPPELLEHPEPVYTGFVPENYDPPGDLVVFVGTEGQPLSISVGRAAARGLDEAAVDEVKKWRWRPAMKNGEPVAVQISIQVKFRLTRSSAKP